MVCRTLCPRRQKTPITIIITTQNPANPPARHSRHPSPSFPRRRESTGRRRPGTTIPSLQASFIVIPAQAGNHRAGHTTRQHQPHRPVILALRQYPQGGATTIQHRHVIADLIRNPEVRGRADSKTIPSPCHSEQSEESKISDQQLPRPVMLTSRQYPQGCETRMGAPLRHCGLDPQSRGAMAGQTTSQSNHQSPSPLMGEESKVRVKTTRQPHHRVIPSKSRNLKTPTTSARHTGLYPSLRT